MTRLVVVRYLMMPLGASSDHTEAPEPPTVLRNIDFRAAHEIRENPGEIRGKSGENLKITKHQLSQK